MRSFKQLSSFLAGPGGILLLIFFFLPWVSVSCAGDNILTASGYDLANGVDEDNLEFDPASLGFNESMFEDLGSEFEGATEDPNNSFEGSIETSGEFQFSEGGDTFLDNPDAKLYILPLIAIIAFAVAGIGYFETKLLNTITSVAVYLIPSLIGLVIMGAKFIEIRGDTTDLEAEAAAQGSPNIISINYELGWWLAILSLIMIFIAGVLVFLSEGEPEPAPAMASAAGSAPPPPVSSQGFTSQAPPFQETITPADPADYKRLFAEAKAHVQAKEFDEARAILKRIDHPTAQQWLAKIDELDPFSNPFS